MWTRPPASQDVLPIAARIEWVLKRVWRGSQSQMARDLGVSQAMISKIVRGKYEPGQKLLLAISAHPAVSANWIMTGYGQPLVYDDDGDRAGLVLPETRSLLPGAPDQHLKLLTGAYPVSAAHWGAAKYWHFVSVDSPITKSTDLQIKPGDRLLVNTDVGSYSPQHLHEQICVVLAHGIAGDEAPVLAKTLLDSHSTPPTYSIDTFEMKVAMTRRERLILQPGTERSPHPAPTGPVPTDPDTNGITKVVGVCSLLVRELA